MAKKTYDRIDQHMFVKRLDMFINHAWKVMNFGEAVDGQYSRNYSELVFGKDREQRFALTYSLNDKGTPTVCFYGTDDVGDTVKSDIAYGEPYTVQYNMFPDHYTVVFVCDDKEEIVVGLENLDYIETNYDIEV